MVSSRIATPQGNCSMSFHGVSARLSYMSPAHASFKAYRFGSLWDSREHSESPGFQPRNHRSQSQILAPTYGDHIISVPFAWNPCIIMGSSQDLCPLVSRTQMTLQQLLLLLAVMSEHRRHPFPVDLFIILKTNALACQEQGHAHEDISYLVVNVRVRTLTCLEYPAYVYVSLKSKPSSILFSPLLIVWQFHALI